MNSFVIFLLERVFESCLLSYHFSLHRYEHEDSNYTEAERCYLRLLTIDDDPFFDPSIVHFEYAMLLLHRLQQHDKARMQFELAIAIDPMYCEALLELALLLASHYGCMEDARGYMARVLAINPRLRIARTKMQEWGFAFTC